MHYNLSVAEILFRYFTMGLVVILGGVFHSLIIMVLALPLFITAILGWSPLYQILHIDHAVKTNKDEGD